MTKYEKTSHHYKEMKNKLNDKTLNQEQLSNLYFGLGKYYGTLKIIKVHF